MEAIDRFVCEENVARCRNELENETDAARRSALIRLLIAEESRLGFTIEQLASVDRHIVRCRELIATQQARIGRIEGSGHDVSRAGALLETLMQSLAVHEQHRSSIRNRLNGMSL